MKHWHEGGWYRDAPRNSLIYMKAGEYEVGSMTEPKDIEIEIPRYAYEQLKQWMVLNDPDGVIRTDRREDLKIIHQILDIMEKEATK